MSKEKRLTLNAEKRKVIADVFQDHFESGSKYKAKHDEAIQTYNDMRSIAKTKIVKNSSSKLKPRPANISRRISFAEIPTYFTPIPIAIKYWAAQIISAGGRLFKSPIRLKMAAKIKGPSIDDPNKPNFSAIHHPKTALIKSNMS